VLDAVSIAAVFVMIISILLNRLSYFKPFRAYFILIYAAFLVFLPGEAVLLYPELNDRALLVTQLIVSASVGIAVLWGHLANRLYMYPERYSAKEILSISQKPIRIFYQLYLILMIVVLSGTWVGSGIVVGGVSAYYPLEGKTFPAVSFQPWYLALLSVYVVAFIAYPNLLLFRLRSQLRDNEIRLALRTFTVVFAMISSLLLSVHAIAGVGFSVISLGNFIDVILLSVVVRAFGKPSFLKAFLGVVPSFVASAAVREDQIVILYGSQTQKYGPFSRFISEGVDKGHQVVCFYNGNEGAVNDAFEKNGVNVSSQILRGNLRLLPLNSLYQHHGYYDEPSDFGILKQLEEEARAQGKEGLRILLDYGDIVRQPLKKVVEHLTDTRWTRTDHFVNVLMAFEKDAINDPEALALLKRSVQVLDLAETPEVFSRTLGLTHIEITGKKILLKYDPLSDLDKMLKAFVAEAASNLERTIVFTRTDGPARSLAGSEPGLKMLLLTTRVSKPSIEKDNFVLLPAYDSSLILDSLDKAIETYSTAHFTVIFDDITHMIFMLGQERAYGLVRQALELMVSDKITAVFLLNLKAHDQKAISNFESLFDIEIESRPETRVPEVRKKVRMSV
jgi:MEDS: MEthanogen/methylotroph, DcmR Sensory domain